MSSTRKARTTLPGKPPKPRSPRRTRRRAKEAEGEAVGQRDLQAPLAVRQGVLHRERERRRGLLRALRDLLLRQRDLVMAQDAGHTSTVTVVAAIT